MSDSYIDIPADSEIEIAHSGDDVGAEVVPDAHMALLLGDHATGVAVIQGTHAELTAFLRRACRTLAQSRDTGGQ
ncbi:hypothetical protein ACFVYA_31090 [Amycolatopsis sp. NPDC058278]|uniref:hypothetical protein n=1 Tax=Amycolatopsis sp. NPDC058278 TaxID=3346417 RepID=UPI0036D9D23D